jgi:drug/metabolite transporter (DMT)-like permease
MRNEMTSEKANYNNVKFGAVFTAILAAALYGISSPISKLLLSEIPPTLMAALLYLGAGFGMLLLKFLRNVSRNVQIEAKITKKEWPYILGMISLDIAAPICLMLGLSLSNPANVSLLNNFEIVATSFLALLVFKEAVGKRMWLAILLITISSIALTLENMNSLTFSVGSVFVLIACICWGFENNCTRMLSMKDPLQIVAIKGIGSGVGSLLISMVNKQFSTNLAFMVFTLILGFVAYGLSIYFYIKAQRHLGAARTSAYYATAPFIGVLVSWIIFREGITVQFLIALVIMLAGSYFAISEVHYHKHYHEEVTHEHKHNHVDGHHNHIHAPEFTGEHSHVHTHNAMEHDHTHTPDTHHHHTHPKDPSQEKLI